jgi:hypothetical protein
MTLGGLQASPGHAQQQNDWILLGRQFRCQMNMAAATICHQASKAAPGAVIGQAIFDNRLTISRWWPRVLDGCLQTPALDSLTVSCCQIPISVACLLIVTRCIAGDHVRIAIREVGSFVPHRCSQRVSEVLLVLHMCKEWCVMGRTLLKIQVVFGMTKSKCKCKGKIDRSCMSCMGSATTGQCRARHNPYYGVYSVEEHSRQKLQLDLRPSPLRIRGSPRTNRG